MIGFFVEWSEDDFVSLGIHENIKDLYYSLKEGNNRFRIWQGMLRNNRHPTIRVKQITLYEVKFYFVIKDKIGLINNICEDKLILEYLNNLEVEEL